MANFTDFSNLIRLPLGIMAMISGVASAFVTIIIDNPNLTINFFILNYLGIILFALPIPIFITCAGMAFNDYYDYEADLLNKRIDRPLVNGTFTKDFTIKISMLMLFIGFLNSVFLYFLWPQTVNLYVIPAVIFFILISISYSTWLKTYGFFGNIAVSLSYPASMILAMFVMGVSSNEAKFSITAYISMIFILALGREVLKGIMDIEGDLKQGIDTIAIKYGTRNAAILCTGFFLVAIPLAPIPLITTFARNPISGTLYSIFTGIALIFIIYSGILLIKDPNKENGIKGRKLTKLGFWCMIIGFFLAALVLGL